MIKKPKKEQLLIGGLIGVLLTVIAVPLPDKKEKKENNISVQEKTETGKNEAEERLKAMLQRVSGVGKAEVFINYADNGKIIVEKDETQSDEVIQETDSQGGKRTTQTNEKQQETVFGSGEMPYVVQQLRPQVEGVLVIAEGGGNVEVKRQIRETIEALFGLEPHKISIMKMEVLEKNDD